MSKTFCIKPWTHMHIDTKSNMRLCCISTENPQYNIKTSTAKEWWNSEFLANVRTQMLNGQEPESCVTCYNLERRNAISIRQKTNKEYKIVEKYADKLIEHFKYPTESPIDIELALTNLCNLKCLMCFDIVSSSVATENKLLKISSINQAEYDFNSADLDKIKELILHKPKILNFRGGETLIVPEVKELLTWALDNNLLDDTLVHITTNGTKLTKDWLDILTSIKNLRIMLSVDGVGAVNDYVRFGSKWATVESAASALSAIPNVIFVVHASVMNLTILSMPKLIKWCEDNAYYLDLDFVTTPKMFEIGVFPKELLIKAKQQLEVLQSPQALTIVNAIDTATVKDIDILVKEINMRDQVRQVSILDVIPELTPYWYA